MKYFIAFALIVAVASAGVLKPANLVEEVHQIQEIIAAIQSPSTDPATAAMLEQMLAEALGMHPEPIAVGPAIVEGIAPTPVSVVENPLKPVGPAVPVGPATEFEGRPPVGGPVSASPASSPLVQIIVNVKANSPAGVNPAPAVVPEPVVLPQPVAPVVPEPVIVVPGPVTVPEPVIVVPGPVTVPEPVIVVPGPGIIPEPVVLPEEIVPVVNPEPVSVGSPVFPIAVQPVVLPETLN